MNIVSPEALSVAELCLYTSAGLLVFYIMSNCDELFFLLGLYPIFAFPVYFGAAYGGYGVLLGSLVFFIEGALYCKVWIPMRNEAWKRESLINH